MSPDTLMRRIRPLLETVVLGMISVAEGRCYTDRKSDSRRAEARGSGGEGLASDSGADRSL